MWPYSHRNSRVRVQEEHVIPPMWNTKTKTSATSMAIVMTYIITLKKWCIEIVITKWNMIHTNTLTIVNIL